MHNMGDEALRDEQGAALLAGMSEGFEVGIHTNLYCK